MILLLPLSYVQSRVNILLKLICNGIIFILTENRNIDTDVWTNGLHFIKIGMIELARYYIHFLYFVDNQSSIDN